MLAVEPTSSGAQRNPVTAEGNLLVSVSANLISDTPEAEGGTNIVVVCDVDCEGGASMAEAKPLADDIGGVQVIPIAKNEQELEGGGGEPEQEASGEVATAAQPDEQSLEVDGGEEDDVDAGEEEDVDDGEEDDADDGEEDDGEENDGEENDGEDDDEEDDDEEESGDADEKRSGEFLENNVV